MITIGIDPSVRSTGIAVFRDNEFVCAKKIPVTYVAEYLHELKERFDDKFQFGIENPGWYGRAIVTRSVQKAIVSTIHQIFGRVKVKEVAPATWRKAILSNYRAKKEDAIIYCRANGWDMAADDNNTAEAACIAAYTVKEFMLEA